MSFVSPICLRFFREKRWGGERERGGKAPSSTSPPPSLPPPSSDLHDVEFVATPQACLQKIYKPLDFLSDPKLQAEAGLLDSQAGEILGEGDEKIVAAFQVLMKLRDEGLVKDIGISGEFSIPSLSICGCL